MSPLHLALFTAVAFFSRAEGETTNSKIHIKETRSTRINNKASVTVAIGGSIGGAALLAIVIAAMWFLSRQKKETETRKWIPPPNERKLFDLKKKLPKTLSKKSSSLSSISYYSQSSYTPSSPTHTLNSTFRTQYSSSSSSSSGSSNRSFCTCGNNYTVARPSPVYRTYSYQGDTYNTCATYNPTETLDLNAVIPRSDTFATVSPTDTIDLEFCAALAAMPNPSMLGDELYNPNQLYAPRVPPSPAFSFVSGATMAAGLLGTIRRNDEQSHESYQDVKDGILDAEPEDAEALPLYEPRLETLPEMDSREIFQAASNPIHEMP